MKPQSHEHKRYQCDLLHNSQVIDLEKSVLATSPGDWRLEPCDSASQGERILRHTKLVHGLIFQFGIVHVPTAERQDAERHHTLQVLEPSSGSDELPIPIFRQSNPWTTDLAARLQATISCRMEPPL